LSSRAAKIAPEMARSDGNRLALSGAVDRPLDLTVRRARQWRRTLTIAATIALVAAALLWPPALVSPTLSRARIRTAAVEVGPVEATITASGVVVPEVEQAIVSPVDARVLRILARPGAELPAGAPLVELDVSESRLAVEKLAQDLAIKENQQAQTRLTLDKQLIEINSQAEVKGLQLESLRSQLERDRQLSSQGLLSQEQLKKSELAVSLAAIELKQLESSRDNARVATRTELEGLALEMAKLRKEETEARRQLDLASARADRPGVLTWALDQEGVQVRKGDVLARIADLSSFRVDATVSDVHARRLTPGLPVIVAVNDDRLEGTVASVLPTVQNGAITVNVRLADRSSPLLRPNLRVDVQIVTARKARTLRLKRGPFATGEGTQQVFVIHGDRAVRQPVQLGVSSVDYVEIVQGLAPGDEAIISDMTDYARLREVRIR
jgi:HlyD family secretion protein